MALVAEKRFLCLICSVMHSHTEYHSSEGSQDGTDTHISCHSIFEDPAKVLDSKRTVIQDAAEGKKIPKLSGITVQPWAV